MQRVEDIIRHIGDAEVLEQVDVPPTNAHKRRSALKARQSLTALQPLPRIYASSSTPSTAVVVNTDTTAIELAIGYITRRRRARHARLKELAKEDACWLARHGAGDAGSDEGAAGIDCPVCLQRVHGDRDVVEAHVDACLAYESRRAQVEREREQMAGLVGGNEDADVDVDVDTGWDAEGEGSVRTRVITTASLTGTGIHIRRATVDTEDEIDIDGTDDTMFGDAQFGEEDVQKAQLEADTHGGPTSDEDMDKLDMAILTARSRGDNPALILALEAKLNAMPAPATCRVCLSPYVDATTSTGCWHTCCATCWVRCLGTTKLCPMCQRITGASELRRVYI